MTWNELSVLLFDCNHCHISRTVATPASVQHNICCNTFAKLSRQQERNSLDSEYLIVMDVFQSVADHADSHVDQIGRGHLEHLLGELLTVLVDLLSSNTGELLMSITNYIQEDTSLLQWTQMSNMSLKAKL